MDVWRDRHAAERRPPARTALGPLAFGALSPQMFVLAQHAVGGGFGEWRVRTVGSAVEALLGPALAGAPFHNAWAEADRPALDRLLAALREAETPRMATCRGETAGGGSAVFELLLAPLTGPFGATDRGLGLLQPLTPLSRLEGRPLRELHLLARTAPPSLRLVVDNTADAPLGSPGADVAER